MTKRLLMIAATAAFLVPSAQAGDAGDPGQNCDGGTQEMVDCLNGEDRAMGQAHDHCLPAGDEG
jgi:hypothetical protein